MTREDINKSLHRSILSGQEYNGLISKSTGKVVNLAKGNTAVAIKEMAKWAKKHIHETKKLALVLAGKTVQETINNIQWFLFWHIQYTIDGEVQKLKSPAIAWETRKQGTDCKSYTIFASTILLNLGIKHYLRRIKQDVQSDAFTHVYVVIPNNQTTGKLPNNSKFLKDYLIIDGTIELNNELPFNDKDDIYMEPKLVIQGLSSPFLACGCNTSGLGYGRDTQIPVVGITKGYDLPDFKILEQAFKNFYSFLDELERQGLPREAVNGVINHLEYYIDAGIEPTVGELFGIDSKPYGLGLVPAPVPLTVKLLPKALKFVKKFGPMLTKLIPKDLFSKTFGAVFANGFNLSCWNSTFTPAKVADQVSKIHVPFFETAVGSVTNTTSTEELEKHLNFLLKAVDISYVMYAEYLPNGANWRSCSREAIQIYTDVVTGAKTQTDMMLKQIENEYDIEITEHVAPAEFTYPQAYTGQKDYHKSEKQHGNATYRQVKFRNALESFLDTANDVVDGNKQKAGDGALGIVLGLALVTGIYFATKDEGKKTSSKK
ncbi:hypothetical protein [Algibacter sp. PT7-4]|uniref:hypothetical protein n=1 Tax=Algibacter ulvanivorans TaxID=3400999 RepID=UPI003AAEB097